MSQHDEEDEFEPRPKKKVRVEEEEEDPKPKKRQTVDEEDEDPKPKKRRTEEEEEDPKPKKKAPPVEEDEEDEPKPKKKSSKHEDEEEEDEPKKGKKEVQHDDEDISFDDDKAVENALKRKGVLEKLTVEPKKYVRFAFVPGVPIKMAHVHYINGQGNFRCISSEDQMGICCEKLGEVNPTFYALVMKYSNAASKDGKLPTGEDPEGEILALKLSQTAFRDIRGLAGEDGSPMNLDIRTTPKPGKKGYAYERMTDKPKWKNYPALVQLMKDAKAKFGDGKALSDKFGKKLNRAQWVAQLAGGDDGEEADLDGIDDI